MKLTLAFFLVLMPAKIKRFIYIKLFGFEIHETARIGMSLVMPGHLSMGKDSKIGHLNVIKGVAKVSIAESASIGSLNWISGFPKNTDSLHFVDQIDRVPALMLADHAAITNRHLIDCTDSILIGKFATVAGFRSQLLTHSISIATSRQVSRGIEIGDYTFVGTGSILLPGSSLPSFSVLGAGSILNKKYLDQYCLYAGNPARFIKTLDPASAYFNREKGFVI
ncbi:MAG: acyltransferase [Cytophaga sp.]|nr:acyltransferase [Undibacterium sp.]